MCITFCFENGTTPDTRLQIPQKNNSSSKGSSCHHRDMKSKQRPADDYKSVETTANVLQSYTLLRRVKTKSQEPLD